MSQNVLTEKWAQPFIDGWCNKEYAAKAVERYQKRVEHAMKVLDETPVGERVCFEGYCPSGPTYDDFFTWDGSDEMREEIAVKAYHNSNFTASAAWLVRCNDVERFISVAGLRI